MKPIRFVFLMVFVIAVTRTAYASDPCATLLCMAGKLQGQPGGSACSDSIGDYFSIVKFKKRAKFDPGQTASARLSFLTSCPGSRADNWPARINNAYGTIRSLGF